MRFVLCSFATLDGVPLYWKGGRDWTLDIFEAALFTSEDATKRTADVLAKAGVIVMDGGAPPTPVNFGPTQIVDAPARGEHVGYWDGKRFVAQGDPQC